MELRPIDPMISKDQLLAINRLVLAKYYLDLQNFHFYDSWAIEDLAGRLSPFEFAEKVFPFIDQYEPCGAEFSALVPVAQTLGFGCKWRSIKGDERERRKQFITDPKRASLDSDVHRAEYGWIKPLGLIIPFEGKNRVDFLREEGVDFIPAVVTPCDYPDAIRIQIYKINVKGVSQCWAVLDGEKLQANNHPSLAVPVLKALGVEILEEWPNHLVSEFEVFDELAKLALPHNQRRWLHKSKYIYLSKVIERVKAEQDDVAVSLDEIGCLRLRSKERWWLMLLAMVLSIGAFFLLPDQPDIYVAEIAGAVFGAVVAFWIAFTSKLFIVERKLLK